MFYYLSQQVVFFNQPQLTKITQRKMLFSKLSIILIIFIQIFNFSMATAEKKLIGMNAKSILSLPIKCKTGSVYRIRKCRYIYKWK